MKVWDQQKQTSIYRLGKQRGPAMYRELYSIELNGMEKNNIYINIFYVIYIYIYSRLYMCIYIHI